MLCSVLNCNNKQNPLEKNSKISFHRFPVKKELKTTWIKATGQNSQWKPTKSDFICSEHFKPNLFRMRNKKPCLNGSAVPTLKCIVSSNYTGSFTPKSVNQIKNIANKKEVLSEVESSNYENYESTDDEDMGMDIETLEECGQNKQTITSNTTIEQTNSINDTLDDQLVEIGFKITSQNRLIKHFLQRQRRYNARLPKLRDQIVNLNKSNETVCTYLENLGFPIASEILSRIIMCDRNEVIDAENPYSESFEKFIVTLYSLSPAAYNLMRTSFPKGVFPDEAFVKDNCSILEIEFCAV